MQIPGKQQEHQVTDFICYPHKSFSVIDLIYYLIILCNTHTSLCILDRNLHLRIARLMMPLLSNAAENKKIPTYAPAQDHYRDCIQGLIFSLPTPSAMEVESMTIGGADPRS